MENESTPEIKVTTMSVGIRYGLMLGAISILYFVLMTTMGIDMTEGIGRWGSTVFYIALIVLAHKYYKDNGDGFMDYGQGMGITFFISAVTCLLSSTFTYIYIKFIDDSFVKTMLEKQEEQMVERGMSQDQIDQAMSITEKFMTPGMMFVFGLIGGIIIIMIIGLLVTIFTKKSRPEMA